MPRPAHNSAGRYSLRQRFGLACWTCLAAGLSLWLCRGAEDAASRKTPVTFEQFLKSCGYTPLVLESDEGKLFIRGVIRDRKYRFLVDTGCTLTALDPRVSNGLKTLRALNAQFDDPFIKDCNPEDIVVLDQLKLGGAEFRNQPAQVLKLQFDYKQALERGILGNDFFYRYHVLIDYSTERLWICATAPPASIQDGLATVLKRNGFIDIPLDLEFHSGITCKGLVEGKELNFVIDTGAPWTVLDRDWSKPLQLKRPTRPMEIDMVGIGSVGSHDVKEAQLSWLQLGGLSLTNVYVGIADLSAWGMSNGGKVRPDVHGLLGAETLASGGAVIDYSSRKLWLDRRMSSR